MLKPNPKCPNYHHARRLLASLERLHRAAGYGYPDRDELREALAEAETAIGEASELPDIRTLDERAALITQAVIDARPEGAWQARARLNPEPDALL